MPCSYEEIDFYAADAVNLIGAIRRLSARRQEAQNTPSPPPVEE